MLPRPRRPDREKYARTDLLTTHANVSDYPCEKCVDLDGAARCRALMTSRSSASQAFSNIITRRVQAAQGHAVVT